MSTTVTILDYGMCNLLNVARAFGAIEANVKVTLSATEALQAERLVVPGVGAFKDSMAEVTARGFDDAIKGFVASGRPFMGVCVGMQMLFEGSEEFGYHAGLGIIPGKVEAIPNTSVGGEKLRVPHIGWNELVEPAAGRDWAGTLMNSYRGGNNPSVYFVHSFAGRPEQESDRLADCLYGDHRLCAGLQRDNIIATQFHPERSGEDGLNLLRTFMAM